MFFILQYLFLYKHRIFCCLFDKILNRGLRGLLNKLFYISRYKLKISGFKSSKSKISNPIWCLGLIEIYFKNKKNILEVKGILDIVGKTPIQSKYIYTLHVWVFVCLFLFNKRQNGWTDRAQILFRSSRNPKDGLSMLKICV